MFRKTLLASAVLAALASPAWANYQTGYIAYQEGRYSAAYIEFKSSADAGNASAQYMLGRMFQEGRGIDRDLVQALAWYDLAAANGSSEAAYARNRLAPQLTSYQLQTAATLTNQWRGTTTASQPSPTPSPTPAASVPYSARAVQLALNRLGYNVGAADGIVGPKTRAAIRAYQIDSGLPASGEPSVALHEHLQASLNKDSTPAPSQPAGPSATLISEVQAELRLRGYSIPTVNGVLDAATVSAIKRYQQDASLSVDGQVSDTLLAQLRSGRPDPGLDYRAQVKAVQTALNARGYDAGPADGALGPRTRAAIRAFQTAEGMSASGQIDATLLAGLDIDAGGTPTTPSTGGAGATTIAAIEGELVRRNYAAGTIDGVLDAQAKSAIALFQRDAKMEITGQPSQALLDKLRNSNLRNETTTLSQQVWQIETALKAKGYRFGPIDGTLDAETVTGIEDYQREAGLTINGKPSAKLLASLETGTGAGSGEANVNLLTARQTWEVEARLQARGYNVGVLDTKADAKTYAAVRAYQQDEGLAVTGRIDESLLQRLQLADAGQQQQGTRELTDTERGMMIVRGLLDSFAPKVQ